MAQQRVRELHKEYVAKLEELQRAQKSRSKAKKAVDSHQSEMWWWERWLGISFGQGRVKLDKQLVKDHESEDNVVTSLDNTVKTLDAQINMQIDYWLRANDGDYHRKVGLLSMASKAFDAVSAYELVVENALIRVERAKSMEKWDMYTNSSATTFLSSLNNQDAKTAVERVKRDYESFAAATREYHDCIRFTDLVNLGDLEMFLDMFANNIFTSMQISDQLSKMRVALGKILGQVQTVKTVIGKDVKFHSDFTNGLIQQVRSDWTK